MNKKLYDALENCIQALAQGQDLESALARYPDLADQLRPMLDASHQARTASGLEIPSDVQRRGRARLMQRASEMREARRAPRRRMIPMFSRMAITLGLVGGFFLGSTGLVSASSGSLPGDNLYSVKRTWEDVRLTFTFSLQSRDILESQFEQERLDETSELLTKGRSVSITFVGLLTDKQNEQWMVSGIPVLITNSTHLPSSVVSNGVPVEIIGTTRGDGKVVAEEIKVLQPGVSLPPLEPSGDSDTNGETDNENHGTQTAPFVIATTVPTKIIATTPNVSTPEATSTSTPAPEQSQTYEFTGVVQSVQNNIWIINGQTVYVDQAQISDNVIVGSIVKLEGYTDSKGKFVATRIEVKSTGGNSGGNVGSGGSDNQNQNNNINGATDNTNNTNGANDNHNNNHNENENHNSNGG